MSEKLFTAGQLAGALDPCEIIGDPDVKLTGVACDSREVVPGDLFVALAGQRTDGHEYVRQALDCGAAAAMISTAESGTIGPPDEDRALLCVPDPLLSLGEAAKWYASRFSVAVIAVTGSLGKTTCKDLTASVLDTRYRVLRSSGNYNTEIGIPLTLFELTAEHQIAVLEVAMRKPGDLTYLARMLQPEMGVLTNVAESHMEFFGSLAEIAAGKGELFDHLTGEGWAVINGQDSWGRWIASRTDAQVLFYHKKGKQCSGQRAAAGDAPAVTGGNVELDYLSRPEFDLYIDREEPVRVRLPVAGQHHIMNALAAASVGVIKGVPPADIGRALTGASVTGMRTEWILSADDEVIILNDAYNSSPTSCKAALRTLASCCGRRRKVAILGDMLELGQMEKPGHTEVGRFAAEAGIDYLLTVGPRAELIARGAEEAGFPADHRRHLPDVETLLDELDNLVGPKDAVLVKASRGCRLERCVNRLQELFPPADRRHKEREGR